MKQDLSLDDLHAFLAIADAGGLAGAVHTTGVSAPTLSRRMTALEASLNMRLFERGPRGYALTAQGRALCAEAAPLRETAQRVARFAAEAPQARVRITAGPWTAHFLAQNLHRIWSPDALWTPEFVTAAHRLDIARREADIGIRNTRPDQSWMSVQRTARVSYARWAISANVTGLIAPPEAEATTPSARWVWREHRDEIVTTVNSPLLARELALAGLGAVVLPELAAQGTGLQRQGPPIADLTHDEWLTAHHEARHDPPVRAALDAIASLLTDTDLRPGPDPQ